MTMDFKFVPLYTGIGCFHYTSVAADKSTQVTDNLMDVEMCLEACSSQAASTHFMIEIRIAIYELLFLWLNAISRPATRRIAMFIRSKRLCLKRERIRLSSVPRWQQPDGVSCRCFLQVFPAGNGSFLYISGVSCRCFLQVFPANGSLISLPLLPYRCIRLAMTSATWEVKSIAVTLYYPDKYTNAPYFVIEGVYGLMLSTTESTTETTSPSSEAQSTTIVNEMSTAAVIITVQVSTAKPSTAPVPNNSQITCLCDCDIFPNLIDWDSLSPEEKERMMKFLIEDLRVNKENLSSTIRRKSSASDKRKSSAAIGCIGIVVLSIVLGLLVMPDVFYFLHYLLKTITQKFTKKT
ncbi:hypothetical protein KUTeg_011693 [Tegillarca granosa]|uniref:Uncharacterized protein n=1 Tax=Tegillarca granosa TaxID=220873 RepID=A0ABQ9EXF0_TEGGR|nr:hypothetical protein KUTeg_011693 [Tegillarca granosa]